MAKDTKQEKGKVFLTLGGVDESIPLTSSEPSFSSCNGVAPFYYRMHQRMFGKKIIDFFPDVQVMGVHQTFNGICQYGYYLQTDNKLYYHLCSVPPDMRINFTLPTDLGQDG